MTQVVDFKRPEFWKAWYTENDGYFGSPFSVKTDVASGEYYLWNQLDEPGPGGGSHGCWDFFNTPTEMAAYLRYIILPRFFQLLITMEGEEPHAFEFYDLKTLVAKTKNELDWDNDECALILTTLNALDTLLQKKEVSIADIITLSDACNAMWRQGSDWSFRINPFDSIVDAGECLFLNGFWGNIPDDEEANEEFGHTLAEWKGLCRKAQKDETVYREDVLPSFSEPLGFI